MIASLFAAQACAPSECFAVPANIAFGICALLMIGAAIKVVTETNIVHAALYLVVVLAGVVVNNAIVLVDRVNYLILQAEFLAVTQFLVYIGAIIVLFLFGIMLTRAPMGRSDDLDNAKLRPAGIGAAVMLLVVLGGALLSSFGETHLVFSTANSTTALSDAVFNQYLIPFEVVSVMLLAALIGAIVLARRD